MSYRLFVPSSLGRGFLLFLFLFAATAAAQINVIPVPLNPEDPSIPAPTYAGRPTVLKAIARGGPSNIYFRWDADGDGVWDLDAGDLGTPLAGNWYYGDANDLSFTFYYPDNGTHQIYRAVIQAADLPSSPYPAYASTYVRFLTGFPEPGVDPDWAGHANDWQLGIMRQAALGDALWYLHDHLVHSDSGTSQIIGYTYAASNPRERLTNTAMHLEALLQSGYLPAYPPGTYEELGGTPPTGFLDENDIRWDTSPYGEDALRLMNYLLANIATVIAIPGSDEADDGTVPVPGTNDGYGWAVYNQLTEYSPAVAMAVAALSGTGMEGTVAQIGSHARGKSLEFIVQQLVDYLVAAQIDENSPSNAIGAWAYSPCFNCGAGPNSAFAQHFGWAVHALHAAETRMGPAGVHVPDFVKMRLPNMLYYNQHTDGGPRYNSTYSWSFFDPVGHFLLACRWLGWDQFSVGDATPCGYPSVSLTRDQARQIYDDYRSYADSRWTTSGSGALSDANTVLWQDGDYESGVRGHTWFMPMYELASGPDGTDDWIGGHDWAREFSVDLVYQQAGDYASAWYYHYTSNHYTMPYLYDTGQTALAAALMAFLTGEPDTTPPVPPSWFSVDYATYPKALAWSASSSLDVVEYRIYRGDVTEVPVDEEHLVASVGGTSWYDPDYSGWDVHYRLVAVDYAGNQSLPIQPTQLSGTPDSELPARTALGAAYPNPFNPSASVPFELTAAGPVSLVVYDLCGRRVATLLNGVRMSAGHHEVRWNGRDTSGRSAATGSYLFRLETDDYRGEIRAVLVK